ncbi:hypothetical protein, partial [Salmonella sp. gx-f5]|uniref:hypothetical protein n=1 Tax=Salmonella sp. gx-f5 TaxID=2582605 RepID=UPI001F1FF3DC
MEGSNTDWREIIRWIKTALLDVFSKDRKFTQISHKDLEILNELNIPLVPVQRKLAKAVAWKRLSWGGIKL